MDAKKELEVLKKILNTLPSSIYWKDMSGRYAWLNTASVRQLESKHKIFESIIGKTDFEVFPEVAAREYFENDQQVTSTGQGTVVEEEVTLPDGKTLTQLSFKEPLYDDDANIVGLIGYTIDITERKLAERAKSAFIANMSHDIRTPITGMVGMAQYLIHIAQETQATLKQNPVMSNADLLVMLRDVTHHVESSSQMLMEATEQLLQLCNQVLEVTRLEGMGPLPQSEVFNMRALVHDGVALFRPVVERKGLTLGVEVDGRIPPLLQGMKHYIERTLLNLLGNAVKFTQTGSVQVKVVLREDRHESEVAEHQCMLQLSVEDTGIGIPEDKFDVIFERFTRLTPSYQGIYEGSGSGLYAVKQYVSAMRGSVNVSSGLLGHGTCFSVMLPLKSYSIQT